MSRIRKFNKFNEFKEEKLYCLSNTVPNFSDNHIQENITDGDMEFIKKNLNPLSVRIYRSEVDHIMKMAYGLFYKDYKFVLYKYSDEYWYIKSIRKSEEYSWICDTLDGVVQLIDFILGKNKLIKESKQEKLYQPMNRKFIDSHKQESITETDIDFLKRNLDDVIFNYLKNVPTSRFFKYKGNDFQITKYSDEYWLVNKEVYSGFSQISKNWVCDTLDGVIQLMSDILKTKFLKQHNESKQEKLYFDSQRDPSGFTKFQLSHKICEITDKDIEYLEGNLNPTKIYRHDTIEPKTWSNTNYLSLIWKNNIGILWHLIKMSDDYWLIRCYRKNLIGITEDGLKWYGFGTYICDSIDGMIELKKDIDLTFSHIKESKSEEKLYKSYIGSQNQKEYDKFIDTHSRCEINDREKTILKDKLFPKKYQDVGEFEVDLIWEYKRKEIQFDIEKYSDDYWHVVIHAKNSKHSYEIWIREGTYICDSIDGIVELKNDLFGLLTSAQNTKPIKESKQDSLYKPMSENDAETFMRNHTFLYPTQEDIDFIKRTFNRPGAICYMEGDFFTNHEPKILTMKVGEQDEITFEKFDDEYWMVADLTMKNPKDGEYYFYLCDTIEGIVDLRKSIFKKI